MNEFATAIEQVHFLRPYWLLALPIAVLLGRLLRHAQHRNDWQPFIEPALLKAQLTRPATEARITPRLIVNLMLYCWVLGLAGPTWQRLPSPLVDDTAPLVVGLYLGESMLQDDLKPSRLSHAKQKITRLLKQRQGSPTALLVYAGSSHTVLPLTEDNDVLALYLEHLEPRVVPTQGNRLDALLENAKTLLQESGGAVVVIGDDLDGFLPPPALQENPDNRISISFLSVKPPLKNEAKTLSANLDRFGIDWVTWSVDNRDINAISDHIKRRWQHRLQQRDDTQWQDMGAVFVWPLMLLMALFYRRGMVLQ